MLPLDQETLPWDRRPLIVILATTAVLVLVGMVAGIVGAKIFGPGAPQWQPPAAVTPSPSEAAAALPEQPALTTVVFSGSAT